MHKRVYYSDPHGITQRTRHSYTLRYLTLTGLTPTNAKLYKGKSLKITKPLYTKSETVITKLSPYPGTISRITNVQ